MKRSARLTSPALFLVLLALFAVVPAFGQTPSSAVLVQPESDNETLEDYERRLLEESKAVETKAEIAEKPTAATPAQGFAERVNGTIADFLPFVQFAVNSVTTNDDETAVTVKFNPLDTGRGALSLSATAAEPKVFTSLEEAIAESARATEGKRLLEDADDFSDTTASLTYGYQRKSGKDWDHTRRMYGRNYDLYRDLANQLLNEVISRSPEAFTATATAQGKLRDFSLRLREISQGGELSDLTMGQIRSKLGTDFEQFLTLLQESANAISKANLRFKELDALPALIDNQPQATATLSRRFSDEVTGPESTSLNLHYEMGTRNINRVLREYKDAGDSNLLKAFEEVIKGDRHKEENKFIFDLTYKETEAYDFDYSYNLADPDTGELEGSELTAGVHLPQVEEWQGSVQWTRLIRTLPFATNELSEDQQPRFSLSLEAIQVDGDPARQSRVIGKLSFILPFADAMSMPITLTYADRAEFLTDQDEIFAGHIGITYKLNRKQPGTEQ